MLKFAEEKGFMGRKWSEVVGLTKSYIESKDPKKALQKTLSDIKKENIVASVQFGEEDPILGINTSPVFNVAVKDNKVVLTPFKNGQKGTPIEMTKEEFIVKCAKENGVMNIVKNDSQQIEE